MFDKISSITPEQIYTFLITSGLQILVIVLITFVARWLLRWLTRHLMIRIQNLDGIEDSELDRRTATIFRLVYSAGLFVIFTTALLMVLDIMAIDITPILASLGVLGLAIGLGVQTLVKDVVSGIFILTENQYLVGDAIEVNGLGGTVETITIRSTKVRDLYGTLHTIPNGDIRTVSNKTRHWSRAVVDVGIAYEADVAQSLQTMREVGTMLRQDMIIGALMIDDPEVTGVEGLDDWAIRLRLLVKTLPGQQFEVQRQIRQHIHRVFSQKGIEIAYPRQDIKIVAQK
jgi:small conductance mechanosensitive channel